MLLKLDVQAYEAQVLTGGREFLRKVRYVLLEASFRQTYQREVLFADVLEVMRGAGFRFLRPVGWLASPHTGEILQTDVLSEVLDR